MEGNPCELIQEIYNRQCQEKKVNTDYRLIPLIDQLHVMNCLNAIRVGLEICKEFPKKEKHHKN